MGVILDSTILIIAERAGKNPRGVMQDMIAWLGDSETALPVITVLELGHVIERADSAQCRTTRERFLDGLLHETSVEPTVPIALRAARLDAVYKPKESARRSTTCQTTKRCGRLRSVALSRDCSTGATISDSVKTRISYRLARKIRGIQLGYNVKIAKNSRAYRILAFDAVPSRRWPLATSHLVSADPCDGVGSLDRVVPRRPYLALRND